MLLRPSIFEMVELLIRNVESAMSILINPNVFVLKVFSKEPVIVDM